MYGRHARMWRAAIGGPVPRPTPIEKGQLINRPARVARFAGPGGCHGSARRKVVTLAPVEDIGTGSRGAGGGGGGAAGARGTAISAWIQ